MNTLVLPPDPLPAVAPMVKALALIARLQRAALFLVSLAWLDRWCRQEIAQINAAAEAAEKIDDPLEAQRARLEEALRNDPPELRRAVLAALDEVHARTAQHAATLRAHLPVELPAPGNAEGETRRP